MNTNSTVMTILCYGDSNTWGRVPGQSGVRYSADVRWTGVLQSKLGDTYAVIEEGLCSRSTTLDDPDRIGKNGETYLVPCLQTHNPVDIIILMLGTNDLKEKFHRTPEQIAYGVEKLVQIIEQYAWNSLKKPPQIVLISPLHVDELVPTTKKYYRGAEATSKELAEQYRTVADKYSCSFVDIAQHVRASQVDGYHLDPESHVVIAEVLEHVIRSVTPNL